MAENKSRKNTISMRNSTKLPRINNIRCLESWWNWQKTNRRNCLTNRCKAIYKTHQFITCKLDKQDAECRPQLRQCHRMKCCAPTPTYVYINIYLKCYIYAFSSCVWRRNCASSKHKVVIHILNNKKKCFSLDWIQKRPEIVANFSFGKNVSFYAPKNTQSAKCADFCVGVEERQKEKME